MASSRTEGILITGEGKSKAHSTAPSGPARLPGVLGEYQAHLERRELSPRTMETYGECLRAFRRFLATLGKPAAELGFPDLMAFHVWLSNEKKRSGGRFSAAYRSTHITVVRGLYRWLYAEGVTTSDPGKRLKLPKIGRPLSRDILTIQETRRLLASPDRSVTGSRDRIVLRILALSGPRASELAGLDVRDVAIASRELTIRHGKGAKDRLIFFDQVTARHLARYLKVGRPQMAGRDEPALIVDNKGRRVRPIQLRAIIRRCVKKAGINRHITCHSLRHTFCTNLLRGGANLKSIAELAGHASLDTTADYTRVNIADLASVYHAAHPLAGRRT